MMRSVFRNQYPLMHRRSMHELGPGQELTVTIVLPSARSDEHPSSTILTAASMAELSHVLVQAELSQVSTTSARLVSGTKGEQGFCTPTYEEK